MKSTKKIRFQKTKKQTIKKRSNRNKKVKRRRTRKRNKIYGGMTKNDNNNNTASYNLTVLDDKGNNLLHLAVINNDAVKVKKIIDIINNPEKGYIANLDDADDIINIQNNDGNTPLHLAILNFFGKSRKERKHIYFNIILPILETKKVKLNKIDSQQNTPLHLAIIQYDKDIYDIPDNYENLHYCTYRFFIKRIVQSDFEFTQNEDKNSPLHLLVYMLKKHLKYDKTESIGNRGLKKKRNSDIREENKKIHELILEFVDILKENYKDKLSGIFSMKNEDEETAYDILQSSPDLQPNTLIFPYNYKRLINIDPESVDPKFQQNKKTQSGQTIVKSKNNYTGQSERMKQTYKIRNSKPTKIPPPFRQTVLTSQ